MGDREQLEVAKSAGARAERLLPDPRQATPDSAVLDPKRRHLGHRTAFTSVSWRPLLPHPVHPNTQFPGQQQQHEAALSAHPWATRLVASGGHGNLYLGPHCNGGITAGHDWHLQCLLWGSQDQGQQPAGLPSFPQA